MTLIIGILCSDGIVMASDSASTDLDTGTKQPSDQKIVPYPQQHMIFGGSGDVGLIQKIQDRLGKLPYQKDPNKFRKELKNLICEELKESNKLHVPYPSQSYNSPPIAICILAGFLEEGPFLLEFERDGRDTDYGRKELGGFVAIGSGKPWALALFRPHLSNTRMVQEAKVISYRILSDAIALASYGLAEPINMFCINNKGKISKIENDEKHILNQTCELWRRLESETLSKALTPNTELSIPENIPDMESTKKS